MMREFNVYLKTERKLSV